ncbi:MAG: hypothetical protein ACE5GD_03845 [Candidatus Geothermarchaeales archaeon]
MSEKFLKGGGRIVSEAPHHFPDTELAHITHLDQRGWLDLYRRSGLTVLRSEFVQTTAKMLVILMVKPQ